MSSLDDTHGIRRRRYPERRGDPRYSNRRGLAGSSCCSAKKKRVSGESKQIAGEKYRPLPVKVVTADNLHVKLVVNLVAGHERVDHERGDEASALGCLHPNADLASVKNM